MKQKLFAVAVTVALTILSIQLVNLQDRVRGAQLFTDDLARAYIAKVPFEGFACYGETIVNHWTGKIRCKYQTDSVWQYHLAQLARKKHHAHRKL